MFKEPSPLTSCEFGLIEELVLWNTKINCIKWILGHPGAALYAQKRYKALGVRPPNGMAGSAVSRGLKLTTRMQYSSMAKQYQNCLARGMDRREAMLSIYRLYWREYRQLPAEEKVKSSIWVDTTRRLDCRTAAIQECHSCGGSHLVGNEELPDRNARCMWCNHQMPIFDFDHSNRRALGMHLAK